MAEIGVLDQSTEHFTKLFGTAVICRCVRPIRNRLVQSFLSKPAYDNRNTGGHRLKSENSTIIVAVEFIDNQVGTLKFFYHALTGLALDFYIFNVVPAPNERLDFSPDDSGTFKLRIARAVQDPQRPKILIFLWRRGKCKQRCWREDDLTEAAYFRLPVCRRRAIDYIVRMLNTIDQCPLLLCASHA